MTTKHCKSTFLYSVTQKKNRPKIYLLYDGVFFLFVKHEISPFLSLLGGLLRDWFMEHVKSF